MTRRKTPTHSTPPPAPIRDGETTADNANLSGAERLARGFAHDFNNLLAIINGNVQLAGQGISDARIKKLLKEAEIACEMGARLTERIKSFAMDQKLTPVEISVNSFLRQQILLLAGMLGPSVKCTAIAARERLTIIADQSALENAILNLALNARDAMPSGGRLEISAGSVNGGSHVRLAVKDSGSGMPPNIAARAFDPFFTTKPKERGTGLGLATVYGFAKQSGGYAEIESHPGQGTTVSLVLPSGPSRQNRIVAATRSDFGAT